MRVLRGAQVVLVAAGALVAAKAFRRRSHPDNATTTPAPAGDRTIVGPAVDRRVLSWSRQSAAPQDNAALSPERERDALESLRQIAEAMPAGDREAIEGAIDQGRVRVRLLGPEDGIVWDVPGRRIFDIDGVQTFSVTDPKTLGHS